MFNWKFDAEKIMWICDYDGKRYEITPPTGLNKKWKMAAGYQNLIPIGNYVSYKTATDSARRLYNDELSTSIRRLSSYAAGQSRIGVSPVDDE